MGLLHLIDRPEELYVNPRSRHGLGAAVSAASHMLLAAALIVAVKSGGADAIADAALPFNPRRVIWIPNSVDGGGHQGGGNRSQQPARPAQARGTDRVSVPAAPQPSATSVADAPIEPIAISAQPVGSSHQMLPGPIASETPGDALGRNIGAGGDGDGAPAGDGNGPRGFGDGVRVGSPGVTAPIVIQQVKPQYTPDAMRAKIQGAVWLECIVLPDGTVGDVRITRSIDPRFGLDEAAIAAAKQWRFKPGLLRGQPVPVAISIELTFTLR